MPKLTKEEKVKKFSYALVNFQKAMEEHTTAMTAVHTCINGKKRTELNEHGASPTAQKEMIDKLDVHQIKYQADADIQMVKALEMFDTMKKMLV